MQDRTLVSLGSDVIIRPLCADDSIPEITQLLHRAYKRLLDMGLHFVATAQTDEETRERLLSGESFLAEIDGEIVGTITLYPTSDDDCAWYRLPNVMHFGQYAVEPDLQGAGIGKSLLDFVELRATALGATEIALDTSEKATHLIEMYSAFGYRIVGNVQWESVNYRSVILSKPLDKPGT